ncbi:hypothetical protein [Streptomyces venezuelae]|uniref:hypothetical protein n=1 Tax=Streptomyces venezuelae TaxID=54571 RepID=UPI001CC233A4|nr:hypothetical protein [Streptomyces venezuelae]
MTADGNTAEFMAIPGSPETRREGFARSLADLLRVLGIEVAAEPEQAGGPTWEQRARAALRELWRRGVVLSDYSFDALMAAAVHDPNPSFNRQFVEPALNAFGHRRVQAALLDYLLTGTDPERAGAARAWYWSALTARMPEVRAEHPAPADDDDTSVLTAWYRAALAEFVRNEHLDVRRCILPLLPLRKSSYRPELHALVDEAVAIARSHPDEYIRHRVEHQVGD